MRYSLGATVVDTQTGRVGSVRACGSDVVVSFGHCTQTLPASRLRPVQAHAAYVVEYGPKFAEKVPRQRQPSRPRQASLLAEVQPTGRPTPADQGLAAEKSLASQATFARPTGVLLGRGTTKEARK